MTERAYNFSKGKVRGKPFVKGQCANPLGRPKGAGNLPKCKTWADEYGLPWMARVVLGKELEFKHELSLRLTAAMYLIDKGYGKQLSQARIATLAKELITAEKPVEIKTDQTVETAVAPPHSSPPTMSTSATELPIVGEDGLVKE